MTQNVSKMNKGKIRHLKEAFRKNRYSAVDFNRETTQRQRPIGVSTNTSYKPGRLLAKFDVKTVHIVASKSSRMLRH